MPTALYTVDQVFTFFISVLEDLKEPNWHFEKGTKNVSRKMFYSNDQTLCFALQAVKQLSVVYVCTFVPWIFPGRDICIDNTSQYVWQA